MSLIPNKTENSSVNNNSKIIIISKGRIISAKDHINYITLKEGEKKLTMQISNSSLSKNDINKALKNFRSQNLKNSKSNINILEIGNDKNSNINLSSKEKKYFKLIFKPKETNKIKLSSISTTKKNIFVETTDINKEESKNKESIKSNKLNIIIPTNSNRVDQNLENDDIIDDIIVNENIGNKLNKNNSNVKKKNEFKIKIADIIDSNLDNEIEKNKEKNIFLENKEKKLSSKEIFIEGKNEMKKKLSSQEMSMNNNEFEELRNMYIDSSRSKECASILNNNLIDKNNQKTRLSKANIISKSEDISDNNNIMTKRAIDSAIVNLGDSVKGNYGAQNLITEMEGDLSSNKKMEQEKIDLISEDDKTIKIEENQEEDNTEEKEKNKDIENTEEKKSNEMIKINNININNMKNSVLTLNKNRNEKNENENKSLKYRSLNFNNIHVTPVLYNICKICEHTLPINKLFSAQCNQHYFCKKCAKNYFEDIIEDGKREIVCPLIKCKQPVNLEDLKQIISEDHFKILTKNLDKNQKPLLFTKLKTETVPEDFELYTEKHVLDIDSNKKFFNFNSVKDIYCPICNKNTIFSRGNSHFFKCLYCESKRCKYCLKEFTNNHLDLSNQGHCKVYYRYADNFQQNYNYCLKYLLELFFVLASFYLSFVGAFLLFKRFFYICFNMKKNKNCIKFFFLYLLTFILFLFVAPIIFIFFPVFPSLLAFLDF